MAELTEENLIALFEAAEKASEGLEKTSEGLEKAGEVMKEWAEAANKAIEVLERLGESFSVLAEAAEAAGGVLDGLDSVAEELREAWEKKSREIEIEEAKFSGPKSGKQQEAEIKPEGGTPQTLVKKTNREETVEENLKNSDGKLDLVLFTLDRETEAEKEYEKLLEDRNKAEVRYYRKMRDLAKDDKAKAKAEAAYKKAVQKEYLHNLRHAAEEEEKIHKRREQIVNSVGKAMTEAGGVMVDAMFAALDGEKVSVAAMLETFLKGVAKKHTLMALSEVAMAFTSAATLNPAGTASHLAAAGMHAGVAGLALGGSYAAKAVAGPGASSSSDEGVSDRSGKSSSGDSSPRSPRGDGSGGSDGEGLEAQDVPISHEHLRRNNRSARPTGGAQITINNPHIYGAGGVKEFAATLRVELDRQDRAGRRPRI